MSVEAASSISGVAPAFVCVWRHRVAAGKAEAFVEAYGPEGKWVELFRKSPDFLASELLKDHNDPALYVTIDRWKSARAYKAFRTAHAAEYLALDTITSELTDDEELIAGGGLQ